MNATQTRQNKQTFARELLANSMTLNQYRDIRRALENVANTYKASIADGYACVISEELARARRNEVEMELDLDDILTRAINAGYTIEDFE